MVVKNNVSTLVLFGCLLLTLLLITVNANELGIDDETSFSYVIGAKDGPENWGNLNPNWTTCGTGKSQSPINILDYQVNVTNSLGDLNRKYHPTKVLLKNKGHDIEVEWEKGAAGGIIINGDEFKLQQCHWHIPAEHTVNGHRFDMELHIVHANYRGDIAVVGILYKCGCADPFLAKLLPYLPLATPEGYPLKRAINPSSIKIPGREYYRYNGSLTTPPCSENVTWTVFKKVKTVSYEQIQALKDAVHDGDTGNARPTQPTNGRTVYAFKPRSYIESVVIVGNEGSKED
ncbi:Alpha carbonic anhydrase 7 [Sesamum alatum]|uniref:Alpha carbonic anhydrase 7 n=1 Tax=Sesamum alatum TaxID=300844 RepID=A0AAE1XJ56_9LAMI|nr:Alpha carbonic anhydrase 7 [Sesamum alatum]